MTFFGAFCSSGPHNLSEIWRSLTPPEEDNKAHEGLEGMSCEEELRALGLSGLERRKLRGNLLVLCSFLGRGDGQGKAEHLSLVPRDREWLSAGLDWTLGNISFLRESANTGTDFLHRSSVFQGCQCLSP